MPGGWLFLERTPKSDSCAPKVNSTICYLCAWGPNCDQLVGNVSVPAVIYLKSRGEQKGKAGRENWGGVVGKRRGGRLGMLGANDSELCVNCFPYHKLVLFLVLVLLIPQFVEISARQDTAGQDETADGSQRGSPEMSPEVLSG